LSLNYSKFENCQKPGIFDDLFSILTVFRSFFNFGSILAQELNSFICEKNCYFLTPLGRPASGTPGGGYMDLDKNIVTSGCVTCCIEVEDAQWFCYAVSGH
jgi:hypothetical protein